MPTYADACRLKNRWGTASPAMVDAFYSYDKNGIFAPAGILQVSSRMLTYADVC
jgi:hypothetical protein